MSANSEFRISILLATYNWPSALALCLQSLRIQTDLNFEILIADDGSRDDTRLLIEHLSKDFPVNITHLWQEDIGFRKSRILNQSIERARGEYLIFLDGDCIVQPSFVAQHRRLAHPNGLVTGSRILLSKHETENLCKQVSAYTEQPEQLWANTFASTLHLLKLRLKGGINKVLPLLLKLPDHPMRAYPPHIWRRIKGCNMACWRKDALNIPRFDESFEGWGHEDADFVFRLEDSGVKRRSGSFATEVLHLWHQTQPNDQERVNRERVLERINSTTHKVTSKSNQQGLGTRD